MTAMLRCNRRLPKAGDGPCQGYLDRMQTAKTVAIVSFAGAGLAAIVSGILLSAGPAGSDASAAAAPGAVSIARAPQTVCAPSLTAFGGACRFSY